MAISMRVLLLLAACTIGLAACTTETANSRRPNTPTMFGNDGGGGGSGY